MADRQVLPGLPLSRALFRFLLAGMMLFAVSASAAAEKTRLAIIGADTTEPARSLLTAEFSKRPEIIVLERAELEKAAGELALQSHGFNAGEEIRAGKLLHADVLLLLSADAARKVLSLRLVAVSPGVVLFEDSIPLPLPAPEEWAAILTKKLSPFLVTLAGTETPRIPLSILQIRSVTGGEGASRLEKELGFLLAHRLMNEPLLWVLERSKMGLLEWENALKASPQPAFWTGSYLLDGTLTPDATGFAVTARLRSASKGEDILLSAHAPDLRQIAESLAGQITAKLNIAHVGGSWDADSEARQYQEEALWAFRWSLFEEASQASEAAWALGLKNDTLALLRFYSEAVRISKSPINYAWREWDKPEPWAFESAFLALDRLQEGMAWKGRDLPQEWVALGADCLWNCSLVLRAGYYAPTTDPDELEALKTLRARIRALAGLLKIASERFPLPLPAESNLGFKLESLGAPLHSLYVVRGIDGPLWQEDAQDCVTQMRLLFDEMDHLNATTRRKLKGAILLSRGLFFPWIAYWNPSDRSRVPLAALKTALLNSPAPDRPMDVALIIMERWNSIIAKIGAKDGVDHLDSDQVLIAILNVQKALWDARDSLLRKEIPPERFASALGSEEFIQMEANMHSPVRIDAEIDRFRFKLFKYLLSSDMSEQPIHARILAPRPRLLPEEARELLPLVGEALKHHPESELLPILKKLLTKDANDSPSTNALSSPAHPPGATLRPTWTAAEKDIVGNDRMLDATARYRQGRVYLLGSNPIDTQTEPMMLYEFDPKTALTKKIVFKGHRFRALDFDLVNDEFMVAQGDKVSRYVAAEDRWKDSLIPGVGAPKLFSLDGILYIAGYPGIVIRLDPSTEKSDVIVSSRRKPAQTILDDVPPYDVARVFKDGEGTLCLLLGSGSIFRRDAKKGSWEEVFNLENAAQGKGFDRSLLLNAIGPDGFQFPNRGFYSPLNRMVGLLTSDQAKPNRLGMIDPEKNKCGVFDGTDFWLFTNDSATRQPQLRRISAAGDSERSAPIELNSGGTSWIGMGRMEATPEGIFLYVNRQAHFFSRADLDNW